MDKVGTFDPKIRLNINHPKKQNMNKKIIEFLTVFLAVSSLILFFLISFFRWKYNDDFVFPKMLETQSLFSFAFGHYMNWDAKFLMPFGLFWFGMVKYLGFNILMPLASISFIGISFLTVRIFEQQTKTSVSITNRIILTSIVNGSLFLLLYHTHGDLLYWMSGSGYIHGVMFSLLWVFWFYNKMHSKTIFLIFTFFVSTIPQNIVLGLAFLILIEALVQQNNELKKRYLLIFSLFVIGISLSTFSPGSFKQFEYMHSSSYKNIEVKTFSLIDYVIHFFKIYIEALKPNYGLFILLSLFFVLIKYTISNIRVRKMNLLMPTSINKRFDIKRLLSLALSYKWFLVSFFSLTIYWPTMLYGYRYYLAFYIFLFIALILNLNKSVEVEKRFSNISFILIMGLMTVFSSRYYITLKESILVNKFMNERELFLIGKHGAEEISVDVLDFNSFTRSIRTSEISSDSGYVTNLNYESFYNIKNIKVRNVITKDKLLGTMQND
jgi:hypothetical protein